MSKRIDLTGKKFGKLTVLKYFDTVNGLARWECKCDCGGMAIVNSGNLKGGNSKSCGSVIDRDENRAVTHGHRRNRKTTPEFNAWYNMKRRCYEVTNKKYPDYGGRGITVCDRWKNSFENFLEDMGFRPTWANSVERTNVNGMYEPLNCKWGTVLEQARNKRNTVYVIFKGKSIPATEACEKKGIDYLRVRKIKHRKGVTTQEAFDSIVKPFKFINHSFGHIT